MVDCNYCPEYIPPRITSKGDNKLRCKSCDEPLGEKQLAKLDAKKAFRDEANAGKGLIIGGNQEKNWTSGRRIPALPTSHPDHMVTSESQMDRVYKRNRIDRETGTFVDDKARTDATAKARPNYKKGKILKPK